jgi:hypothetical protein
LKIVSEKSKLVLKKAHLSIMKQFFGNLKSIRKMIRMGKPPEEVIQVCPVCLSNSLTIEPNFLAFIAPKIYYCTVCEYKGPIFAEIPVEDYNTLLMNEEEENYSSQIEV